MGRFRNSVKMIKYIGKLGLRLQKLDEPMKRLRDAGGMPESLERVWGLSGAEEGVNPPQCPREQPAIVDNASWALFDYVRELEKNAPLFDERYHDAIAECVGVAEMFEQFLREESDPKELKKWEKKNGRTYEGPTEREKYYASLQEKAAPAVEPEPAAEPEPTAAEPGAEPEVVGASAAAPEAAGEAE